MTTGSRVTIWHRDEDGFSRGVYGAHVRLVYRANKNGIKQRGFFSDHQCLVRIPTAAAIGVSVGDYLRIGVHSGEQNREVDFIITEIADNRVGSEPHVRLKAER